MCFNNLIYNIQISILLQPLSKCWYILKKLYSGLQIPYASLDLANIIPMPLQIVISAPFSTTFIVTERFYCFKIYRTVQKSFSNSTLSHNNGLYLKSHWFGIFWAIQNLPSRSYHGGHHEKGTRGPGEVWFGRHPAAAAALSEIKKFKPSSSSRSFFPSYYHH